MFIVLEIQTNADGTVGTLINAYSDQNQAESKYHLVLSSAAVSALPVHACSLFTSEGFELMHACYKHAPSAEPTGKAEG